MAKSALAKRKLSFQEASKLHGKTLHGHKLRLVKEDEMEDDKYYVAVATGDDATIKVDGGQVYVGPFDSPETAQAAVGADAEVVDGENVEPAGEPAVGGEPPMESRAGLAKRKRLETIRRSVIADILKEAGIEVDTSVGGAAEISDGGSGELDDQAVGGKVNQAVADAGKQRDTGNSDDAPNTDGVDGEPMPKVTADDHTLDANGGQMHESNARAFFPGNMVRVTEKKSNKQVDSGIVMKSGKGEITLEGNVTYSDNDYNFLRLA